MGRKALATPEQNGTSCRLGRHVCSRDEDQALEFAGHGTFQGVSGESGQLHNCEKIQIPSGAPDQN